MTDNTYRPAWGLSLRWKHFTFVVYRLKWFNPFHSNVVSVNHTPSIYMQFSTSYKPQPPTGVIPLQAIRADQNSQLSNSLRFYMTACQLNCLHGSGGGMLPPYTRSLSYEAHRSLISGGSVCVAVYVRGYWIVVGRSCRGWWSLRLDKRLDDFEKPTKQYIYT